ncbi:hypothetical protein PY093_13070 [Cytobacillus sp. S13-E01]|uniref:hypothetical protein n=1 Tax=Cytobacillus sp. S13-E01 TaxID=3031326 RepID=UPI0023D7BF4D|nr:hypothetical protein [Cytobacillus sp. S13-E01]MDF0727618.1 hypothetical protein [Cytobacillus sp. S13-E01]
MQFYYNPEVKLLLIPQSKEIEEMIYANNKNKFNVPKIGPRPPYYYNPRYDQYYPVI